MSNTTTTSVGQTTSSQTSLLSTTTTPLTTPLTTAPLTTSSIIAATPATTQLVTSIVSVSASNGTPQPPSTVIVTRISTPTPITITDGSTTSTSSSASQSSDAALQAGGSKSSNNGGLSPAGKTAIAVVIPVVVIALLVLAGLFLWRRRKQRKSAEDERRKEMEAYGFNPNQDPSLPAVGGVAAAEMMEDQSGYRGWGTTSASNRKASTTLSGGLTQPSDGGYDKGYSPGSPTQPTISDHSGDPIIGHQRQSTMDSETVGALGAAPLAAGAGRLDVRRGPSNASSHYSVGDHSTHSGDVPLPVNQDYYADNAYFTPGPYENQYSQGGQPVIRENPARRNTRIQEANVFPQQGTGGIAQNF